MASYKFDFSKTNDLAAGVVGLVGAFSAYVVGHMPVIDAVYAGVMAAVGVLGYTGTSVVA